MLAQKEQLNTQFWIRISPGYFWPGERQFITPPTHPPNLEKLQMITFNTKKKKKIDNQYKKNRVHEVQ